MPWDEKISRRLKLKDLQTLMAVIEAGGMGKAADRLNYSQPAVSKAIAGLERTLGKRLFERNRKGIELTPYGNAMIKCGAAVFDDLRRGVEEIEFLADPSVGKVRVVCTEPVSAGLVSGVIERLVRRYPGIQVDVVSRDNEVIGRELEARTVDFAITQITAAVDAERFQAEILYHEPVVVVAGIRHPCVRKRRLKLADLVDEPWALPPPGSFIRSLVTNAFRTNGLPAPLIAVTAQAHMRVMLVASTRLLTAVPAVMLQIGARQLAIKAVPIALPANRRPVGIVTLKNRPLSPVAQLFIEQARSLARTMTRA